MKSNLYKKILNKGDPKIEPRGPPNKISPHELNSKFFLVFRSSFYQSAVPLLMPINFINIII